MLFKKVVAAAAFSLSLLVAAPAFAHTVKPGDTMSKIARSHEMSLSELANLNPGIENLNLIYPGQTVSTEANNNRSVGNVSDNQNQSVNSSNSATAAEKDLLARLVHAEANGESQAGKVAVAKVVLNRVASGQFPGSITGVIMQPGQFSPVSNGSINNSPNASDRAAVEAALSSGRGSALYFYNPSASSSSWLDSRATVEVIGNHVFKK